MTSSAHRWWILAVIGIAQLMVILDNSIVNIALPSAQADLGFDDAQRQWIVTAYALAFGSLLLLGGRLSDMFGRKQVFVVGLIGFAAASILGGLAPTFGLLVAARAGQGVFGAVLAPAALSLLTTTFPSGRDRARAFGVFSALAGSGAATGLLVGGALTEYVDWRWCMYVNAVFAAVALVGALVLMPSHSSGNRPHLDLLGTVLASAGLFGVVFGFASAETSSWTAPQVLVSLAVGVVLLIGFVLWQRREPGPASGRSRLRNNGPLLPLRIVLNRHRGGSFLTILVITTGMFALGMFLAFVLQRNFGFSPMLTGVAFLPMVGSIVLASNTMPVWALPRVGPKVLIVIGLLLGASALFWLSFLTPGAAYTTHLLGPMILMGLGMGTAMSTAINTATLGVDPREAGVASATVNTMQQVGGSVGTALLSSVAGTATAAYAATAGGAMSAADVALLGYDRAFLVASLIFVGGAVICGLLVPAGRPHRDQAGAAARSEGAHLTLPAVADGGGWGAADTAVAPRTTHPALAQPVTGTVTGGAAGPVTLTLVDLADGIQVSRAAVAAGHPFTLHAPRPGTYLLVARAAGSRPVAERVTVLDEPVDRVVSLDPAVVV